MRPRSRAGLGASLAGALLSARPACPVAPSAEEASRILSLRNVGIAELEEGKNRDARSAFGKLADLVPGEALPWADEAVAALRDGDLDGAGKLLDRAAKAGGERADVWAIRAALEDARNRPAAVRAGLARAAALDPRDMESRWRFVRSVESDPAASVSDKDARRPYLAEIIRRAPSNLPARLKLVLLNLEAGEGGRARGELAELDRLLADADPRTRRFLSEARQALGAGDLKTASLKVRIVENLLRVTSRYQQSLGEVFTNVEGLPLTEFSAALEASLRPGPGAAIPVLFRPSALSAEDPEVTLRRVDLQNTGKAEIYVPPSPYRRAAFFDYDLDGDLDVYLHDGGRPDRLLRNNLDGTFTDVTAATGDPAFASLKAVPVDVDRDGDLDLVTIDANGQLVLRLNLRQGLFRTVPLGVSEVLDVAVEDVNADGFPDIVAATRHGLVLLVNRGDGSFSSKEGEALRGATAGISWRLVALADLDNDGFPDIVAASETGLFAFRNEGRGAFSAWNVFPAGLPGAGPCEELLALDVDHDGDLDLVVKRGGKTSVLLNDGGNANAWLDVVLEGLPTGSGKVNRSGVGSLIEVKAGDLYVARTAGLLPTHFGLGRRGRADVVRCLWTNGVPQNLLDQRARVTVREVQQLKGSCPFVYAYDGVEGRWSFVSDALGRAPLGLLKDGVHLAGADPREWLYIDGGQLSPTPEGKLLLDYTEELWEVCFLDEATLMAVDHPEGTGIVPNERMVPGILPKKLFTVARRRPVRAFSDAGGVLMDVTDRVARKDGVYVDPGPETRYQGLRDVHRLTLDLGPLREGDRVILFLTGWIFYTDTSINVSVSQRHDIAPLPPVLEVPDGRGGWRVAMASFGYPAGKTRTMPVDLTGLVDPKDPRVRIRTSLAIFWDEIFETVNDPPVACVTTLLPPEKAVLSERGFSRRYRATPDGPELFDPYDVSHVPAWEDIPGRLTRYGDVTGLLKRADDRWVAFKGGDGIRIQYDASRLPPLPAGWRRDWILISDGWDKDFDRNTVTGQSYGPWPFHAMSEYPYPASESYPDPAFLKEWLTREVGPEEFRRLLQEPTKN